MYGEENSQRLVSFGNLDLPKLGKLPVVPVLQYCSSQDFCKTVAVEICGIPVPVVDPGTPANNDANIGLTVTATPLQGQGSRVEDW